MDKASGSYNKEKEGMMMTGWQYVERKNTVVYATLTGKEKGLVSIWIMITKMHASTLIRS